jgi:hypothetical protein
VTRPPFIQFFAYFKLFSTALGLVNKCDYFSPTNASPLAPVMRAYAQITNIFIGYIVLQLLDTYNLCYM